MKREMPRVDFYKRRLKQVLSINHVDAALESSRPSSKYGMANHQKEARRRVAETRINEAMNDRLVSQGLQLQSQVLENKLPYQTPHEENPLAVEEAKRLGEYEELQCREDHGVVEQHERGDRVLDDIHQPNGRLSSPGGWKAF